MILFRNTHRSRLVLSVLVLLLLVSLPGRSFADTAGTGAEAGTAGTGAVTSTEEVGTAAGETVTTETAAGETAANEESVEKASSAGAGETETAAEEPNILQDLPVIKPQPHYADPNYVETPAEQQIFSYVQTPYTYYKVRRWVGPWHRIQAAGQTFLNFGCGICCLTNMFDTIKHRDITPDRMYEKCIEHSSYAPHGSVGAIDWKQIKTMCDYFGFQTELKAKPRDYAEFQKDAAENKTLLVLVCKDNDSRLWYYTRGHYVNLWEYDAETDSVFVTDASGLYNRERVPLSFVYAALKTASNYQYMTVKE